MRKLALIAAVAIAAAFSAPSNVAVAQGAGQDLNPNTTKLMQDAFNPGGASAGAAAPGKMAKKGGKKKSAKKGKK